MRFLFGSQVAGSFCVDAPRPYGAAKNRAFRLWACLLTLGLLLSGCANIGARLFGDGEDELELNPLDVAPLLDGGISDVSEGRGSLNIPALRPKALPPPPLQLTREVKREIRNLLRGDANCIRVSLERRDRILSTVEQIFRDEGIPHDLMNLAIIESRYASDARSRSGALGIWQFTRSTARLYGLRVDTKVDQRRDTILATLAAARFLRDLYEQFGDWYLALAAYNAGPGAVQRALTKTSSDSFWALSRTGHLSRQTRDFVPRFIAATIIVKTAEKYGLDDLPARVVEHLARYGATLKLEVSASKQSDATKLVEY